MDCVGCCVMIYALNHVVMCMRSGSAEKYGSQSEPINCVLIGTVAKGFTVPETVIAK